MKIRVVNTCDRDTVTYPLPLLTGDIEGSTQDGRLLVSSSGDPDGVIDWPVIDGCFKALVRLQPGENIINLRWEHESLTLRLTYDPPGFCHVVKPVYIVCADDDGYFQGPPGMDCSPESAARRIGLGSEVIQTLTAEKMREQGFPRRSDGRCGVTFQLETGDDHRAVCKIFRSRLRLEEAYAMNGYELWNYFGKELMTSPSFSQKSRTKFYCFMSFTRYNLPEDAPTPKTHSDILKYTQGHTALGGGNLALFGTGNLHTWADHLSVFNRCLTNRTKMDRRRLMDDSAYREYYWANYATGLGASLHELGHTFDLAHTPTGIMARGFDDLHKVFTVQRRRRSRHHHRHHHHHHHHHHHKRGQHQVRERYSSTGSSASSDRSRSTSSSSSLDIENNYSSDNSGGGGGGNAILHATRPFSASSSMGSSTNSSGGDSSSNNNYHYGSSSGSGGAGGGSSSGSGSGGSGGYHSKTGGASSSGSGSSGSSSDVANNNNNNNTSNSGSGNSGSGSVGGTSSNIRAIPIRTSSSIGVPSSPVAHQKRKTDVCYGSPFKQSPLVTAAHSGQGSVARSSSSADVKTHLNKSSSPSNNNNTTSGGTTTASNNNNNNSNNNSSNSNNNSSSSNSNSSIKNVTQHHQHQHHQQQQQVQGQVQPGQTTPTSPLVVSVEAGFKTTVAGSAALTFSVKNYDGSETRQTILEGQTVSETTFNPDGRVVNKSSKATDRRPSAASITSAASSSSSLSSTPSTLPNSPDETPLTPSSKVTGERPEVKHADSAHWFRSSAIVLRFHKWFNREEGQENGKNPTLHGPCIKSATGLRLVELRTDPEGTVFAHWEFLGDTPPTEFLLYRSEVNSHCNGTPVPAEGSIIIVMAEDANGFIMKKKFKVDLFL